MQMERQLEAAGLTAGEAKVYLALVELGQSTIGPIVKASGVSSSKAYEILSRLSAKGLASSFSSKGAKMFEAGSPKRLIEYMQEKQARLEEQRKGLESIMPYLESKSVKASETASVYQGYKAVKGYFIDLKESLPAGSERLVLGAKSGYPEEPAAVRFFDWEHKQRVAKGFSMRIIMDPSLRKTIGARHTKLRLTKVRYLKQQIAASIAVQGDFVDTLVWKKQPMLFVVRSAEVAAAYREFFENLWAAAKP